MADTTKFHEGESVLHPKFGLGTVLEQKSDEVVAVDFGSVGEKRLSIRHARLSRPGEDREDALMPGGKKYQEWLDRTFSFEEGEARHYLGSHWEPFFDDAEEILKHLPEIIPQAHAQGTYSGTYPPERKAPPDWHKAFYLAWPLHDRGLSMVVVPDHDANHLVSLFPFMAVGSQHQLTLEKVHVWESGVEAQVECTWGSACLAFFDTRYAANRAWYESGNNYQFILTGIAYECWRAEDQILEAWNPKQSKEFRKMAPALADNLPDTETMPVHTKGMAGLLPCEKGDRDDFYFRGPIRVVKEINLLDQPGWKVRVTVLRELDDSDREMDLDIIVTRKVWGEALPPQVGGDMEGTLWLQGYLWCL